MTKKHLGEGSFISFSVHHQKHCGQELQQDRDLEAGADTEAMEGYCSSWLAQPAFFIEPMITVEELHCHNGLGPPPSIIDQENALQSYGDIFSIKIPSF